jgi:hypothetical protein
LRFNLPQPGVSIIRAAPQSVDPAEFAEIAKIERAVSRMVAARFATSSREEADKIQRGSSTSRLWRLRKHPAQIQSRPQIDRSSINISGLFSRDVEGVNCKSPVIFFALFGTQSSAQSNRISYRR